MDKFDSIYQIHRLFSTRRSPVSLSELCELLECKKMTVTRRLKEMRELLGAPIFNVRGQGWRYDPTKHFELPGLWFNRNELEALLAMSRLLSHIGPGLLHEELKPVHERLDSLLARMSPHAAGEAGRIRILDMHRRNAPLPHFPLVAAAVLERQRLAFDYAARSSGESSNRQVSPQRLVHYRDNWYLDAFCHQQEPLRTFSLDRMSGVVRVASRARDIDDNELDRLLGSAYGIFSGGVEQWAILCFSAQRSHWIADEQWHPEQRGQWLADGRYEMSIPYGDSTELILDICRYGPDVEVVAPPELRTKVSERLYQAAKQYD